MQLIVSQKTFSNDADLERSEGTLHRGTILNDQVALQAAATLLLLLKSSVAPILLKYESLYPVGLPQQPFNEEEET